ncbi:aminopeptidase P family protein, partial [Candidatus Babeliales bacterium]|nr:aminopeptidase P family protein [Candidatus Babeliales bacterium]
MNQKMKTEVYSARRDLLIKKISQSKGIKDFVIVLLGGFEDHWYDFRQESSFYYLSGIEEPGSLLCIKSDGSTSLFIPQYPEVRSMWVSGVVLPAKKGSDEALRLGLDEVVYLGDAWSSFSATLLFNEAAYKNIIIALKEYVLAGQDICVAMDPSSLYVSQNIILPEIKKIVDIENSIDISMLIHEMRKTKSVEEISFLHEAIRITAASHEAVASMIAPGVIEYELQSCIESIFLYLGASGPAFPSVVATGKNSTILHYTSRKSVIRDGDVVLVDIGAMYGRYAADVSRTYPASGLFTDRQAEIYNLVLQAQKYIEDHIRPGMFLYNQAEPDKSLHHLAFKFFEYHGCAQYFTHKIGHFLGLDVHDVGDTTKPLQEGDVITIEPGIYLQSEGIGVRIEDDYVVVEDGFVC